LLTNTCDNLEAVKKIVVPKTKVQQMWKSVDLITQILNIWQLQQGKPIPTHVYAHQDDKCMGPLSFLENLNCRMDHLAKRIAISYFTQPLRNLPPSSIGLELYWLAPTQSSHPYSAPSHLASYIRTW